MFADDPGAMNTSSSAPSTRRGTVIATDRQAWPEPVVAEFDAPQISATVGSDLIGRSNGSRIWTLHLAPGERFGVHRHGYNYLWLATSAGRARQHLSNGETRIVDYAAGDHEMTVIPSGSVFDHDLENIGDEPLTFVTVELVPTLPVGPPVVDDEPELPAGHADLLTAAHFAHLATIRPDGSPQSSVMWFDWDGQRLRFTHTRGRQKARNLRHDPRVSVHVQDPAAPYRTLEIRGTVESIEPDPDATFYRSLQRKYGREHPVFDAAERIVITIRPTRFVAISGGLTHTEQQHLHHLEQLAVPDADGNM